MIDFKRFERLSKTEYGIIRNLVVEEGLVDNSQIEQIIEQITKDRFNLGKSKAQFAQKLDDNEPEACKVIIALCYYAMYQSCRAAIFHTHRDDMDSHEKVAYEIRNMIGEHLGKSLDFWRDMFATLSGYFVNRRNEVDYSPYPTLESPPGELALKAISSATSCLAEIENYLKKRGVKL